ncbi:GNAT family N-acetyltransferase [Ichthyenterobacterium magnum]|uniref:Acetyltransferase (GNAT) family protein n=1 Tax=Ichthyenterobacterium magnum TaxID=1230530 RepID=A0A420DX64_9FLAO|nr:GNAT family N-acetyltransferase [Ichthyenterobacterium magnum]RKE98797.1 acetyltransferase (GNAT) family protein [Ichthyenterobacterium magnum]
MELIQFKIYNTVNELPDSWDALPILDVFLKTPFLKALEASCPSNISSYYLAVFKNEKLAGIAIIQRVEMYLDDMFRRTSNNKLKQIAKQIISRIVRGNALVVGNLMHTGQHGLFYDYKLINQDEFLDKIFEGIKELSETIKQKFNKKIRIIAFKDYFENDTIHKSIDFFKKNKLYKVQVQPNMMFSVPEDWKTPQDYISAFNKKYRRRYKAARKKGLDIACKELTLDDIKDNQDKLFQLYQNVSDNARVNSFKLHKNHFFNLKRNLKEDFKVFGYFLDDELVGFYTLILNNEALETYFLGYSQSLQHKYQMYLNMLFNMACFGIENGFKTIVYARTAMEIKSSIGAKPNTMHIYLKHTNHFIANTLLKLIVKYMNPIRQWEERHPFK